MAIFGSLSPAEQARQLSNPEGRAGIQVAEWLNDNNRASNAQLLALLDVQAGDHVLEIGFGNGRAARDILGSASEVHYTGIDISPTMVEEATRFNADLVASGRANFLREFAETMPFSDGAFDRVLAVGVIHFFQDPVRALGEIGRVMRPGARALLGTLDPRTRPAFAQQEYGFFLRSADEWVALAGQCSFSSIDCQCVETEQRTADGKPTKRYSLRLILHR